MKRFLFVVFGLMIVFTLSGCDNFNKVNVTYSSNDGNDILRITVEEGDVLIKPDDPVKEGYIFLGWYLEDENVLFDFDTKVEEDMTLYAKWEIGEYTITFIDYNDTVLKTVTGEYMEDLVAPSIPTRQGYNVVGWDQEVPSTIPGSDTTYKATYEEISTLEKLNEVADSIFVPDIISRALKLNEIGTYGVTITYQSSNPYFMNEFGQINRPLVIDQDVDITITATLSLDSESITREFTTTILSADVFTEEQLNQAIYYDIVKLLPDTAYGDLDLPTALEAYYSTITWESMNTDYITDDGVVTYREAGTGDIVVQLKATVNLGYGPKEMYFDVTVTDEVPTVYTSLEDMFLSAQEGDIVEFTGIVSSLTSIMFYLTDGDYAILVMSTKDVSIGDEVRVIGEYDINSVYMANIDNPEYVNILSSDNPNPMDAAIDGVDAMSVGDIYELDGSDQLVHGFHYFVTGTLEQSGTAGLLYLTDGTNEIRIENSLNYSLYLELANYIGQEVAIRLVYYSYFDDQVVMSYYGDNSIGVLIDPL